MINDPVVLAEVEAVFALYEEALVSNDVVVLDQLFWQDQRTIRFGIGENLFGAEEILAFRKARPAAGLARRLEKTTITTYGKDFATAATLFYRDSQPGKVGRQMQTWNRFDDGWKVVAAHVSIISEE
jgi:Protein of unknown function (DUF3225)